jgi:transposase
MISRCPGSANLKTPTLSIKKCPECQHEIEIFSIDTKVVCDNCGFVIYSDISGCVKWCKHAKGCLGEKEYNELIKKDG